MPLLESKPSGGYCAKASIKGVAVTFHLTPSGQKRLLDAGIQPGKKFPLALLADLARQGHAWTPPSVAEQTGICYAEQYDLNLAGDETAERYFAACTDDGKLDDLHLVAWEVDGRPVVKLLCNACRANLPERFKLSVPLPLLGLAALARLEAQGKTPANDPVVRGLREGLAADLSATWETLRRQTAQRQADLGFDMPDELGLR
jgi:hypothetical protein